jgi:hypothetical protein
MHTPKGSTKKKFETGNGRDRHGKRSARNDCSTDARNFVPNSANQPSTVISRIPLAFFIASMRLTTRYCRIPALAKYCLQGIHLGTSPWLSSEIAPLAESRTEFRPNTALT